MPIYQQPARKSERAATNPCCQLRLYIATVFVLLLISPSALSQRLHLPGKTVSNVTLKAVTPDSEFAFESTADNGEQLPGAVGRSDLVSWGSMAVVRSPHLVVLTDGSCIAATQVQTNKESLHIESEVFESIELPWANVKAIVLQLPRRLEDRDKLVFDVCDHEPEDKSDLLIMSDGSTVSGSILFVDGDTVQIQLGTLPVLIERKRVRAVAFGGKGLNNLLQSRIVGTLDGSVIRCKRLKVDSDTIQIETTEETRLTTLPPLLSGDPSDVDYLCFIQSARENIVWLDTIAPSHFRHIPLLGLNWRFNINRSVEGLRLRIRNGDSYLRGIGMHPTSVIQFELPTGSVDFVTEVAMDHSAGRRGSVSVHILLSDNGEDWDEVYTSNVIHGSDGVLPIRIPVSGRKHISLVVNHANDGDVLDHVNWLRPYIVVKPN